MTSASTDSPEIPPASVDAYIAQFPPHVQTILQEIRATIRAAAPAATEAISYRMPAWVLHGHLVYVGAFKSHIGLYPPIRDPELQEAAAAYAGEKGNLRFPLDQPIPHPLIHRIVQARVRENLAKLDAKRTRRKAR